MADIESLRRRIESTEDLLSVVKTMKALAAVNIRHYEQAVEALEDYSRTVEQGIQVALWNGPGAGVHARPAKHLDTGVIVFGSDQGMCGKMNDEIVEHAEKWLSNREAGGSVRIRIAAVGERVASRLAERGREPARRLRVPTSVEGIVDVVQDLLMEIERWNAEEGIEHVLLFYNRPGTGASYSPADLRLLPVAREWLRALRRKPWPTNQLPTFSMDWNRLFSGLIRQYLFVSLHRGMAESLASENASRLASMQGAEKNIEEMLGELRSRFNQQRQRGITEELLDIVSGFEALKEKKRGGR